MKFALVFQANPQNPLGLTPSDLAPMAEAVMVQLNRDVHPVWGGDPSVIRVSDGKDLQPDEVVFSVVDTLPNAPGDIAYHDVNGDGLPVAFTAIDLCNSKFDGSNSVSVSISHECCEAEGDPGCNRWADDGQGQEWALELCDSVESNSYTIETSEKILVSVSDFILPAAQIPGSKTKMSFTGAITVPFSTASGGYQILRASGSDQHQVNGLHRKTLKQNGPQRLMAAKRNHWSSRTVKRLARASFIPKVEQPEEKKEK